MKVLLSIKPEFADLILNGEKQYEFRRVIFKSDLVKKIIVYASSPISMVIGEFEVENVLSLDTSKLWKLTKHNAGIDKAYYDDYFFGKEIGHAIKIKKPKRYKTHIDISNFNIKQAPQSFAYITL